MKARKDKGVFKQNSKRPKANCHVFIVWGKRWIKYGLHYFFKEAVNIAQRLAKLPANVKAWVLVKRKGDILWSSAKTA
jgi:hypothetical protein